MSKDQVKVVPHVKISLSSYFDDTFQGIIQPYRNKEESGWAFKQACLRAFMLANSAWELSHVTVEVVGPREKWLSPEFKAHLAGGSRGNTIWRCGDLLMDKTAFETYIAEVSTGLYDLELPFLFGSEESMERETPRIMEELAIG